MKGLGRGIAVSLLLLGAGCSSQTAVLSESLVQQSHGIPVELAETAFFPQTSDQCGPAAMATALSASGVDIAPADIAPNLYIPGRQGSLQIEMMAVARQHQRIPYPLPTNLSAILAELQVGHPVIILQNLGVRWMPRWHFAVVIGYQPESDEFVLRSADRRRHLLPTRKLARSWEGGGSWAIVVLAPTELPASLDVDAVVRAIASVEAVGEVDAALQGYEAAVKRWPHHTTAWLGVGNSRYHIGDLAAAENAYLAAVSTDTSNVIALNNLATVQSARGQLQAAMRTVDAALALLQPDDRLYRTVSETRGEIVAAENTTR